MASAVSSKHVGETIIYGFRYHSPALDDDETIVGVSVLAQTGITAGTAAIVSPEVSVPISGGTANADYTIRFTVSTSKGQIFIDDYVIKVIA